jgi:hypothetical protein
MCLLSSCYHNSATLAALWLPFSALQGDELRGIARGLQSYQVRF